MTAAIALPAPPRARVGPPCSPTFMNNTASKNEESATPNLPPLPMVDGLLMPWTKDRGIILRGIAKFRANVEAPLDRWIPGMQFRARRVGLVYSLQVERYIPAKFIPWETHYTRFRRVDVVPRTIPHVVVVRVLSMEVA